MVCKIRLSEKLELKEPVLVEGLPGIGLVANIAVTYLIRKLDAKPFGEIRSSDFQDIAITDNNGSLSYPTCQLSYYKAKAEGERDLVLLYGNTQSLTARGQYELCGCILDMFENIGGNCVITLGGYKPGRKVVAPKLYYAASDLETAKVVASLGAEVLGGEIFGIAGLLIGLSGLRGIKGFCLLAETPGTYPDRIASKELLKAISNILLPKLDFNDLTETAEFTNILAPFDFGALAKKRREEIKPDWFI